MTDQVAATSITAAMRRAADRGAGQPFVTCRFCGATTSLTSGRLSLFGASTVREDGARAALNRWMAGNATVKPGPQSHSRFRIVSVLPHVLVRAVVQHDERVLLRPAAACQSPNSDVSIFLLLICAFDAKSMARSFRPACLSSDAAVVLDDQHIRPEAIRECHGASAGLRVQVRFQQRRYRRLSMRHQQGLCQHLSCQMEVPYVAIARRRSWLLCPVAFVVVHQLRPVCVGARCWRSCFSRWQ